MEHSGSAFGSFDYMHEFVPGNYTGHKHDLKTEEEQKIVPPKNSKTSQMRDPGPPRAMRVKAGYTGHVPNARDYIGGTYCSHDNRGSAGKASVPVVHRDAVGNYPMQVKPKKTEIAQLLASCHDVFSAKPGDAQHDYGVSTTAPVAARVDKVLSGDTRDMTDAENVESAYDQEGAGQWIMAGYTGHVPKAREVYATSYYGPPEGPSYHGPYYASDKYFAPQPPNKEAVSP